VLKDLFDRGEMPEMGAEILWDAADDVPQEETAEELAASAEAEDVRFEDDALTPALPRVARPARRPSTNSRST